MSNIPVISDANDLIQSAIESVKVAGPFGPVASGPVVLPFGHYTLTAPLVVSNVYGLIITSPSRATTVTAAPWQPAFVLDRTQYSGIDSLTIKGTLGSPGIAGIVYANRPGGYAQTAGRVARIRFGSGNNAPDFQHGILVDSLYYPDGHRNNNDQHTFEDISCNGYSVSAARITAASGQAHSLCFRNFDMIGNGAQDVMGTTVGIECLTNAFFTFDRGSGGFNKLDFYLGDVGPGVEIMRWNSEWTGRLLETAGPTGAVMPILCRKCRIDDFLDPDGVLVKARIPGSWEFDGIEAFARNRKQPVIDMLGCSVPVTVSHRSSVYTMNGIPGPKVKVRSDVAGHWVEDAGNIITN